MLLIVDRDLFVISFLTVFVSVLLATIYMVARVGYDFTNIESSPVLCDVAFAGVVLLSAGYGLSELGLSLRGGVPTIWLLLTSSVVLIVLTVTFRFWRLKRLPQG